LVNLLLYLLKLVLLVHQCLPSLLHLVLALTQLILNSSHIQLKLLEVPQRLLPHLKSLIHLHPQPLTLLLKLLFASLAQQYLDYGQHFMCLFLLVDAGLNLLLIVTETLNFDLLMSLLL
jgi:hypothetical protein